MVGRHITVTPPLVVLREMLEVAHSGTPETQATHRLAMVVAVVGTITVKTLPSAVLVVGAIRPQEAAPSVAVVV